MTYTINTLAKMSGVSIRTLRFYDEIGLLKPAYVRENGYRYYQEEQLLILQQILFFKELDFDLKQIKEILNHNDFNKTKALQEHRIVLEKKIQKTRELVKTIDKTINHLEGNQSMNMNELYYGFIQAKVDSYKKYIKDTNIDANKQWEEFQKNMKDFTQADTDAFNKESNAITQGLVDAINKKLAVTSSEVQALVRRHYNLESRMYTHTKSSYRERGRLYVEHPDLKKMYDQYHVELAQYLADAMKVFADKEL